MKKLKWTEAEDALLREIYESNSKDYIIGRFPERTWKSIRQRAVGFNLARSKELVLQDNVANTKKTVMEKYGVESSFQLDSVKQKIKETNLKNLGVEYPSQSKEVQNKIRESYRENWGVDWIFQSKEIQERVKEHSLEKYGVESPARSKEANEKRERTNVEKYGAANPFANQAVQDKIAQTNRAKYGVENPQQSPEIQNKTQATNLDKYGTKAPAQNILIRRKTEETNLQRYGVSTPFENEEVKAKIKETNLERYGVENPAQLPEVKEKIQATNMKKYGVPWSLQNQEIKAKAINSMIKNKSFTRSKPEEELLEYLKLIDPGVEHHKKHPVLGHVLDYYSPKYDLWMQFDGFYWHGRYTTEEELRQDPRFNCRDSNASGIYKNMMNDRLQNETIPRLVRFWEDDFKSAVSKKQVLEYIFSRFEEKGIQILLEEPV